MFKLIDLTGKKFNKLKVLKNMGKNENRKYFWLCKCECGKEIIVKGDNLKNGHSKSCGCYKLERLKKRSITHDLSKHRLFKIFYGIKSRCYNKKDYHYKWYGSKGIKIYDEWLNDFKNFYDWAMANGYEEHLTIDRINNIGNYEPSNCRWVTMKEQCRNRTSNVYIEYKGEKKTIIEWSEITGIPFKTLYNRFSRKLPLEKIFSKKDLRYKKYESHKEIK